jgi:hypothetical protein
MAKETFLICSANPATLLTNLNTGYFSSSSIIAWGGSEIPEGWFKLGVWELDTDSINVEDLTRKALSTLDETEKTLRAELHVKLKTIEETRQSILALPCLPVVEKD